MSPISSISASNALSGAAGSGLAAIARGSSRLEQEAQQVADPNSPDLATPLVSSAQSLQLAQAGADVISSSNDMLGTLLDTFA
jgi:hypothetical protein